MGWMGEPVNPFSSQNETYFLTPDDFNCQWECFKSSNKLFMKHMVFAAKVEPLNWKFQSQVERDSNKSASHGHSTILA